MVSMRQSLYKLTLKTAYIIKASWCCLNLFHKCSDYTGDLHPKAVPCSCWIHVLEKKDKRSLLRLICSQMPYPNLQKGTLR